MIEIQFDCLRAFTSRAIDRYNAFCLRTVTTEAATMVAQVRLHIHQYVVFSAIQPIGCVCVEPAGWTNANYASYMTKRAWDAASVLFVTVWEVRSSTPGKLKPSRCLNFDPAEVTQQASDQLKRTFRCTVDRIRRGSLYGV